MSIISIEFNEINHDWIGYYISQGKLKNFKYLLDKHNLVTTISEKKYCELEPWIQWPSFYSGMSFEEHGCFHIGDFYRNKHKSIYTQLQESGHSVLAISPMNCYFIEENNSFFFYLTHGKSLRLLIKGLLVNSIIL